jgi:hypothetical protein
MRYLIRTGAVALVLAGSVGLAVAADNGGTNSGMRNSGASNAAGSTSSGSMSGGTASSGSSMNGSQAELSLTQNQRAQIFQAVRGSASAKAPGNFQANVGAKVPSGVALNSLPSNVTREVPSASQYKYTHVQGKVLLVNPSDRNVVAVIDQADMGGSGAGAARGMGAGSGGNSSGTSNSMQHTTGDDAPSGNIQDHK